MQSNLFIATLTILEQKGFATITAYDKQQAEELAQYYWEGFKEKKGKIEVTQVENISCLCNAITAIKVICGNTLEEILCMNRKKESIQESYQIGNYLFDVIRSNLTFEDGTIENVTTKECELLQILASNTNKIVERDYILEKVWGESNYYNSRSMDVYITKLRKHFVKDERIKLLNVHGKGFKFIVP